MLTALSESAGFCRDEPGSDPLGRDEYDDRCQYDVRSLVAAGVFVALPAAR